MRRALGVLAAAGSLLLSVPLPARAQAPVPGGALLIDSRGSGHGVGMAQDGALALGLAGASAGDILGTFYPGTDVGKAGNAIVAVPVLEPAGPVSVSFPSGGEVRDSPSGGQSAGFPVTVNPGGSVQLSFDGGNYHATPEAGATLAKPPSTTAAPASPTTPPPATPAPTADHARPARPDPHRREAARHDAGCRPRPRAGGCHAGSDRGQAGSDRGGVGPGPWAIPKGDATVALPEAAYRGRIEASAAGGGLRLVNHVDVERYLQGMGEVRDPNWPEAALQAQAIAARTYALWTVRSGRELCPTQTCQVYLGAQAEYAAMNQAVRATRGQVVTFDGALIPAVYSANHAGLSGTVAEGFGPSASDVPYLVPVAYPNADPVAQTIRLELPDVAGRLGYNGDLATVKVTRVGPSGRALDVTLDGTSGPMVVDGVRLWQALALPSTLYTLRQEGAEEAPSVEANTGTSDAAAPGATKVTAATAPVPPDGPWVPVAVGALLASAVATRRVARRLRRPEPTL